MTRIRLRAVVPALALALLMTGCDPSAGPSPTPTDPAAVDPVGVATPTPEPPSRPARADLALGPDGMNTLVFAVAPSTHPDTAMLELVADFCTAAVVGYDTGLSAGDPAAARWIPVADYRDAGTFGDFGVEVAGDVLVRIDLFGDAIPTTEGVRIGDPRSAVVAAYPGATVVEEYLTDIHVVPGPSGTLQIEVASQPDDQVYWPADEVDQVVYIHAVATGFAPFSVAASENIAGSCPA